MQDAKRNILLVVRWPVGGIRTYIKYVFTDPQFADAKITLIAPDVGISAQMGTVFPLHRFRYLPCANSALGLARAVAGELRRNRYDLINPQGFTSAIAAFVPARLFARRTPLVLTVHDVLHPWQFRGWRGRIKRWWMARVFSGYDCIVPVSHDCEANLRQFLPEVGDTRVATILNGVSVDRLVGAVPLPLRQELGVDSDRFLIGFMGRFMAQKGFRYLVDAIEQLVASSDSARRPLVTCYGSGGYYREEKAAIEARGLGEYFRFFDHIEDVGAAMKALDVVVMPSRWEACPLLPMEVLICGTPLIASNCIGLREVVAATPAWVVPQEDGAALSRALQQAMADNRRQEFNAYIDQAVARFDVATTRAQLADLYSHLWSEARS